MWRASRPPERVFTNSEMWVPGLWQSAHLEFMVCAVISAAWADVRGLIFWFGRNRGATARRHDDRAAQNGPGRDEGTCFAHEILNDVELPVW